MEAAKDYFQNGFEGVFGSIARFQRPDIPISVVYAFKQEEGGGEGDASTGWEAMLEGLIRSNLSVVATWPLRTNRATRMIGLGTNSLASAIVILCRVRASAAEKVSRREFLTSLRDELPAALRALQQGNIAPVDLAQAAIGPGMAVFSRYACVLESDGTPMVVRTALTLINQTLDQVLAEQEGEFDADTRWALAWFDQHGFAEGPYGTAETLSTAKNTSVSGMAEAGILTAKAGKVRLLRIDELAPDWNPATDKRFTIWEATHYLVRTLEERGEQGAADLIARLGGERAERARDLSYRLYTLCERRKWAKDALPYNALVQAWPEASRLAAQAANPGRAEEQTLI
jgi:putative DNA methylase